MSDCVKTQLNVDMHWNASIHNNIGICISLPYDRGSIHALSVHTVAIVGIYPIREEEICTCKVFSANCVQESSTYMVEV